MLLLPVYLSFSHALFANCWLILLFWRIPNTKYRSYWSKYAAHRRWSTLYHWKFHRTKAFFKKSTSDTLKHTILKAQATTTTTNSSAEPSQSQANRKEPPAEPKLRRAKPIAKSHRFAEPSQAKPSQSQKATDLQSQSHSSAEPSQSQKATDLQSQANRDSHRANRSAIWLSLALLVALLLLSLSL